MPAQGAMAINARGGGAATRHAGLPAAGPAESVAELLRSALGDPAVTSRCWSRLAARAFVLPCEPGPIPPHLGGIREACWWLVASGEFCLGASAAAGGYFETARIGPGQWLDVAGNLCAPYGWIDDVRCRAQGHLLAVPVDTLSNEAAQHAALLQATLRVMAQQIRSRQERLDEVAACDVPVRLARWVLRRLQASTGARPGARLTLEERKQDLARELCTTSETLSRTLRKLHDGGLLGMRGYELTVLDLDALQSLARQPAYGTSTALEYPARVTPIR